MMRLWFFCAAGLTASVASAQVFECINSKGAREYAQFCPPGTVQQREVLKERTGAEDSRGTSGGPPKSIEAQEVEFKKRTIERQEAEAKAAKEKTQTQEAELNCNEARSQLKALEEGQRMTRIDPATGERVDYGDEERAVDAERQRKAMSEWCKR